MSKDPPNHTHDPRDGPIFITGGEVEAIDHQTIRAIFWVDTKTERRIVARLVASIDSATALNAKIRMALADAIVLETKHKP